MIDRGVFKYGITKKGIEAYHLDVTKYQYNENSAPDYKMLNLQYVIDSLKKMDVIQNCVLWKIQVKLQNLLSTIAITQGLGLLIIYIYFILISVWIIPDFFISNHRLCVGIQDNLNLYIDYLLIDYL